MVKMQDLSDDNLQVFTFYFNGNEVRIIVYDGNPWWVTKEVCKILRFKNPKKILDDCIDEAYKDVITLHGEQEDVISECGFYPLVSIAGLNPEADKFGRWVTNEILPKLPLVLIPKDCTDYVGDKKPSLAKGVARQC